MKKPSRARALLASIRTPNLPSAICNVLTGTVFAAATAPITAWHATAATISGTCLYLAGNLLNDWHDRHWDATHRPERALPQNLFKPSTYLTLAIALCLAGLIAASITLRSLTIAIALIGLILFYTETHKTWKFAVIPMGLCRALLPLLGYFACASPHATELPPALAIFSAGLLAHVCGLSIVARKESLANQPPKFIPTLGYPLAVAAITLAAHSANDIGLNHIWPAALPYLIWSASSLFLLRKSAFTCVSMLLAGIPLVDWMFLIPLAKHSDTSIPIIALLAPPISFILGRSLQKLVPAT